MYTLFREGRLYQTWTSPPDLDDLLHVIAWGMMVRGFSIDLEDFTFEWVPL